MPTSVHSRRVAGFRRASASAGFTLPELLVVIGIIAVLIALLLPSLGRARENANSLKCQAQEYQILQAMMLHAHEHKGFMPVTGLPWTPTGPAFDPVALEDSARERYDYYGTGLGTYHAMSLQGALAPQLGQPIDTKSKATVEAGIQTGLLRNLFACPSDRGGERIGRTMWEGGDGYNSYAFNDAALSWGTSTWWDGSGLASKPAQHSRLRGNTAKFVKTSELFLIADAAPRADGGWTLFCDGDGELTLRDFWVSTYGPPNNPRAGKGPPGGACSTWDLFDTVRHRGRINVGFADGHVENVVLSEATLERISMNKGFPAK